MVYFIQDSYSKAFKIGVSKDPGGRIVELQTGSPYELKLFYVIITKGKEADLFFERMAHGHFDEHRTRKGAEWFQITDRMVRLLLKELKSANSSIKILKGTDYAQACKKGMDFGAEQAIAVRHNLLIDALNGNLLGTDAKIYKAFKGLQDGRYLVSYAKIAEVSGIGRDVVVSFMHRSGLVKELMDYNSQVKNE